MIRESQRYADWFASLKDKATRARIDIRIRRLSLGHTGIIKSVGQGVSELKIDFGPGYRVYLTYRGSELVILLGGGDKGSQAKDIKAAQKLAQELEDDL